MADEFNFGPLTIRVGARVSLPPDDLASLDITARELLRLLDALAGSPPPQTAGLVTAARGLAYCLHSRLQRLKTGESE